MLNEFYSIYRGLEASGQSPDIKHPDIQEPGLNNVTFRVTLGEDGSVTSVRLMSRDQIQHSWSWGNKQTQFPALKVKKPLVPLSHQDYITWKKDHSKPSATDYRSFIKQIALQSLSPIEHIKLWPEYRDNILSRKILLEGHADCLGIYELFNRYSKHQTGVEILNQVRDHLIKKGQEGTDTDTYKAICALLFGEKLKSNNEEVEDTLRITLLLDCLPTGDDIYASSINHVAELSNALFEEAVKGVDKKKSGICSISGDNDLLVEKTFPEEKIAVVGPTILFSKNDETSGPTVERYGRAKGEAISLSEQLSYKMAASVRFLSRDEFKEHIWSRLPNSSLLLAFCHEDVNLEIIPLVTGSSEVEDFEDFLNATENIIAAFKGKDLSMDASVDFIEIVKVDKANRKVNFSTTTRVGHLIESVEFWKQACGNIPDFKLLAQLSKKEKVMTRPWAISPKRVMSVSQLKFIRDGSDSISVPGISFADAMKLFLSNDCASFSILKLRQISDQYEPLLARCALAKSQYVMGPKSHIKGNPQQNTQALNAVTLMSLLLYKSGKKRENYMKDLAFQLGQLCSAMDELHIGYCKSERKGDIPNVLLGNQVYGMALHDPIKALGFMAIRRRPYDSWVTRFKRKGQKTEDKAILAAIYAQRWMSEHAEALGELIKDSVLDRSDTYKAELMLGYLAGRPFNVKPQNENHITTQE